MYFDLIWFEKYWWLFQDRIEGIAVQAQTFLESGHFDADNIKTKQQVVVERYTKLMVSMLFDEGVISQNTQNMNVETA